MVSDPPRRTAESYARRRAAIALAAIGALAGVLALMMLVFLHSGGSHPPSIADVPIDLSSPPPPAHSTTPQPPATTARTTTAAPTPVTTSCPTPTPCALSGDGGRVVSAINTFRAGHGVAPVTGVPSAAAATCALAQGNVPPCPQSYYWEPIAAADGNAVVTKIVGTNGGLPWLLDPTMKQVTVGWSYDPGAKLFACAVVRAA